MFATATPLPGASPGNAWAMPSALFLPARAAATGPGGPPGAAAAQGGQPAAPASAAVGQAPPWLMEPLSVAVVMPPVPTGQLQMPGPPLQGMPARQPVLPTNWLGAEQFDLQGLLTNVLEASLLGAGGGGRGPSYGGSRPSGPPVVRAPGHGQTRRSGNHTAASQTASTQAPGQAQGAAATDTIYPWRSLQRLTNQLSRQPRRRPSAGRRLMPQAVLPQGERFAFLTHLQFALAQLSSAITDVQLSGQTEDSHRTMQLALNFVLSSRALRGAATALQSELRRDLGEEAASSESVVRELAESVAEINQAASASVTPAPAAPRENESGGSPQDSSSRGDDERSFDDLQEEMIQAMWHDAVETRTAETHAGPPDYRDQAAYQAPAERAAAQQFGPLGPRSTTVPPQFGPRFAATSARAHQQMPGDEMPTEQGGERQLQQTLDMHQAVQQMTQHTLRLQHLLQQSMQGWLGAALPGMPPQAAVARATDAQHVGSFVAEQFVLGPEQLGALLDESESGIPGEHGGDGTYAEYGWQDRGNVMSWLDMDEDEPQQEGTQQYEGDPWATAVAEAEEEAAAANSGGVGGEEGQGLVAAEEDAELASGRLLPRPEPRDEAGALVNGHRWDAHQATSQGYWRPAERGTSELVGGAIQPAFVPPRIPGATDEQYAEWARREPQPQWQRERAAMSADPGFVVGPNGQLGLRPLQLNTTVPGQATNTDSAGLSNS
eukprot:TRINITY_DN22478_c0_g1_i1.p1 TRINITY_DN22478_c0_g1~~TRINITY_DN22478_c0_g1_i1.p1  ORF type:complete len:721 (-),score=165.81 TRINITY_DN22478_c0_g1_i1:508-2670(-)